jgi:pimeloyl-ACP methyl ester carboxylesterase
MPFVTAADGVELHYEVEGDGFPLVFTHGNMGFGQQFFLQTASSVNDTAVSCMTCAAVASPANRKLRCMTPPCTPPISIPFCKPSA